MRTQDLTPEQRRELLAAWDAAVRDASGYAMNYFHTSNRWFKRLRMTLGITASQDMTDPLGVAYGD